MLALVRKVARNVAPVAAFFGVYFLLRGFGHEKAIIGAIFAMTVSLWITELLPLAMTSLLAVCLLIVLGGVPEKTAFAAFGDPVIPLFIGSFLLAKAMDVSGLSRRFAFLILKRRWANRSAAGLLLALGVVSATVSLFVSNTATTAMMLPIGLAVLGALKERREGSSYAIGAMLMLTWGSSVAVGSPVSTPPNLIGISLIDQATGIRLSFVEWMRFAMPITVTILAVAWGILWLLYGRNAPSTQGASATAHDAIEEMGPIRQGEKSVGLAFLTAFLLWVAPDLLQGLLGREHEVAVWAKEHITTAVAAIIAASLLFILPARDRDEGRALTWREGTKIDWGTILLFGGGIALGQALFGSGLAKDLGEFAAQATGANDVWAITLLAVVSAIVLSELASNTASATTLVPVAIGLAEGAGVNPIPPALGAAIGASFGFMLPVSTAPNAIVYSSGLVPPRQMMRAGILLDIASAVIIWLLLRLLLPPLGLS
jgi:solute carrier family 13 (sodium-dependent dicarboxylate transporter), member 2/3/5